MLIVTMLALFCSQTLRQKVPINYALLAAVTFFEAIYVGGFTAHYNPEIVLLAIGILAATVLSLFGVALYTPASEHLLKFMLIGFAISMVL